MTGNPKNAYGWYELAKTFSATPVGMSVCAAAAFAVSTYLFPWMAGKGVYGAAAVATIIHAVQAYKLYKADNRGQ